MPQQQQVQVVFMPAPTPKVPNPAQIIYSLEEALIRLHLLGIETNPAEWTAGQLLFASEKGAKMVVYA